MTPLPPYWIRGYFAQEAPVCVIIRRGRKRECHMILWHTDSDEFVEGQWVAGLVENVTLSPDGRYIALTLVKTPYHIGDVYVGDRSLVSHPPFFTALEIWFGDVRRGVVAFRRDGELYCPEQDAHKVNATNVCPFVRSQEPDPDGPEHPWMVDSRQDKHEALDHRGRRILFEEGIVYVIEEDQRRVLFDTTQQRFTRRESPDWAKSW